MRVRFVLGEVVIGLRRNLTMTMALIVTIAISLALLGTGLLVRQQVDQMKGFWFDKVEVSLFLCTRNSDVPSCAGAVNDEQREAVAAELESMKPLVQEVYFETADEAYARFQQQFAGSPIADSATPEDLGESFRVKLSDPNRYSVITSAFTGVPGIERVDDQKQVLDKLFRLLDGLQMVALFIAVAMLIVTLMLVGNTMRLAAHSRQRETGIMRLVGASKWYIQMPFILESMVAAIVGGALAIGALVMIKVVLVDGFLEPNFKFTPFVDWDTVWVTAAFVFAIGVSLSAIAAFVSLRKYLKV